MSKGPQAGTRFSQTVALAAILLVAVVAINTIWSLRDVRSVVSRNNWVEHTRQVADELDGLMIALLNMESGERGYLYSGQKKFLDPYTSGAASVDRHIENLARLVADNPIQQQHLAQLRPLVIDVTGIWQQAIALNTAPGPQPHKERNFSEQSNDKMDQIRSLMAAMNAEERRLLEIRTAEARRSARYLSLAIPLSQGLTAILILLAGWMIIADIQKRVRAAGQLRELAAREHSAREQAEAARRLAESVLSSISESFVHVNQDWRILYVNDQVLRLNNKPREQFIGKTLWQAFPEIVGTHFENSYRLAMETQKPQTFEAFFAPVNRWFNVHAYPAPDALTIFAQDITALRQSREALIRSEKLAAVGRMASTVAHEINNPLEAVTNLIWLVRSDRALTPAARKNLLLADEELRRVAHITKKTLGFYRDPHGAGPVDVPDLIESVVNLYASRLESKRITVVKDCARCAVWGYTGELRQLLSNLLSNSIDALPAHGRLTLRAAMYSTANGASPASSNAWVRITVADDGPGIEREHLPQLFEPFFSTKPNTGTGLGLWVSREIAEKHGGHIRFRSSTSPDRHYTAAFLLLPAHTEAAKEAPHHAAANG